MSNIHNPVNGLLESGLGGLRSRPNTLDLASNHLHGREEGAQSKSENPSHECFLLPQLVEQEKNLRGESEGRDSTVSQCGNVVQREEAVPRGPCDVETEKGNKSVCRDCFKSISVMENKLDNLSIRLERLETKLSSDVEAIFGLLRAHSETIKERKLDFHTQV